MKCLTFVVLTSCFICAFADVHDFSTALNNGHDQSKQLHLLMENHFVQMHALLTSHITVISSKTLDHILHGIDAAQKSNNIECNENKITTTNRNQEIGAGISICSSDADLAIQQMTQKFLDALEGPQETSTKVLNLVLSQIANLNAFDNAYQISAMLTEAIRQVQEGFTTFTLPILRDELEAVLQLSIDIPSKTQVCVAEVLAKSAFHC